MELCAREKIRTDEGLSPEYRINHMLRALDAQLPADIMTSCWPKA